MEVVVSELAITASSVDPSCIGFVDGEIHIDSPEAVEYSFDNGSLINLAGLIGLGENDVSYFTGVISYEKDGITFKVSLILGNSPILNASEITGS